MKHPDQIPFHPHSQFLIKIALKTKIADILVMVRKYIIHGNHFRTTWSFDGGGGFLLRTPTPNQEVLVCPYGDVTLVADVTPLSTTVKPSSNDCAILKAA